MSFVLSPTIYLMMISADNMGILTNFKYKIKKVGDTIRKFRPRDIRSDITSMLRDRHDMVTSLQDTALPQPATVEGSVTTSEDGSTPCELDCFPTPKLLCSHLHSRNLFRNRSVSNAGSLCHTASFVSRNRENSLLIRRGPCQGRGCLSPKKRME